MRRRGSGTKRLGARAAIFQRLPLRPTRIRRYPAFIEFGTFLNGRRSKVPRAFQRLHAPPLRLGK